MSIIQFLRVLWARRLLILGAVGFCLLGVVIVGLVLPPQWKADSRVMLDVMKPDPVTGLAPSGPASRGYVQTQTALITDYAVAGRVADQLGWMSDPALIQQYQNRDAGDKRDFRRWIAGRVIGNTVASVLPQSNVLDINYTATTPDTAKAVADALRNAYLDASLSFRRDDANRNAEWYTGQQAKARQALDAAQAALVAYERSNGVFMGDDKIDLESARLKQLAQSAAQPPSPVSAGGSSGGPASSARVQLSTVESQLAASTRNLGPNHPDVVALQSKRTSLIALAAEETAANAQARAAAGRSSGGPSVESMLAAQKAKVLAQGDKIGRLAQLQSELDVRKAAFDKATEKVASFREEAAAPVTGLTPLGSAVVPAAATFPNWLLLIPGAIVLGLGVGVAVAILAEMFGRRVRGVEDLGVALEAPVLAVIAAPASTRPSVFARALPRLRRRGGGQLTASA